MGNVFVVLSKVQVQEHIEKFSTKNKNIGAQKFFESKIKITSIRNFLCRKFAAICLKNATLCFAYFQINPQVTTPLIANLTFRLILCF